MCTFSVYYKWGCSGSRSTCHRDYWHEFDPIPTRWPEGQRELSSASCPRIFTCVFWHVVWNLLLSSSKKHWWSLRLFPGSGSCPIDLPTWSRYHCYFSLCLNAYQSLDLASCCKIWTSLGHFSHGISLRGQEEILFGRWSVSRGACHPVPVITIVPSLPAHPVIPFMWWALSVKSHFTLFWWVLVPSFLPAHHHLTETK